MSTCVGGIPEVLPPHLISLAEPNSQSKLQVEKRMNFLAGNKIMQTPLIKVSAIESYKRLIQEIVSQNLNVIIFVSAIAHWWALLLALHLQNYCQFVIYSCGYIYILGV